MLATTAGRLIGIRPRGAFCLVESLMTTVRAALYLDFDNVFGGLLKLDPEVAIRFAESPGEWLARLSEELTVAGHRRWLVLRCYLNPEGAPPHPAKPEERLRFSRYRQHFVQAGFEIVDCPRLGSTKNAADIRLAMDALDAIGSPAAYEEFVIASGDSDFTPLLVRLRAEGRCTTVVSASEAVEAFLAVPDRVIGGDDLLALVQGEQVGQDDDGAATPTMPDVDVDGEVDGEALAAATIRAQYESAREPINLSRLAEVVRQRLADRPGSDVDTWFGHSGFKRFLSSVELPHAATSQYYVWDQLRHVPPAEAVGDGEVPPAVVRLTKLLKIPPLEPPRWRAIHRALAEYAARGEAFNLSECSRWTRDRLAVGQLAMGRPAINLVLKGASYGGCPIYRDPPPSAEEIGTAFASNLLSRAAAVEVAFEPDEAAQIRAWFGLPSGDSQRG